MFSTGKRKGGGGGGGCDSPIFKCNLLINCAVVPTNQSATLTIKWRPQFLNASEVLEK